MSVENGKWIATIISVATVVVAVAACSAGGFTLPAGNQCPVGYMPISMTPAPGQALLPMDSATNQSTHGLPAGTYTYSQGVIFYQQTTPNVAKPLAIQIMDAIGTDSLHHQTIPCILNSSLTMDGYQVQIQAPYNISIDASYNETVTLGTVGFNISQGLITVTPVTASGSTATQVSSGFSPVIPTTVTLVSQIMVQDTPTVFEVRAQYQDQSNNFTYYVSVEFNYAALAGATSTQKVGQPQPVAIPRH